MVDWCKGLSKHLGTANIALDQFQIVFDTCLVSVRQGPPGQLVGLRGQPSICFEEPSTGVLRSHNGLNAAFFSSVVMCTSSILLDI